MASTEKGSLVSSFHHPLHFSSSVSRDIWGQVSSAVQSSLHLGCNLLVFALMIITIFMIMVMIVIVIVIVIMIMIMIMLMLMIIIIIIIIIITN